MGFKYWVIDGGEALSSPFYPTTHSSTSLSKTSPRRRQGHQTQDLQIDEIKQLCGFSITKAKKEGAQQIPGATPIASI